MSSFEAAMGEARVVTAGEGASSSPETDADAKTHDAPVSDGSPAESPTPESAEIAAVAALLDGRGGIASTDGKRAQSAAAWSIAVPEPTRAQETMPTAAPGGAADSGEEADAPVLPAPSASVSATASAPADALARSAAAVEAAPSLPSSRSAPSGLERISAPADLERLSPPADLERVSPPASLERISARADVPVSIASMQGSDHAAADPAVADPAVADPAVADPVQGREPAATSASAGAASVPTASLPRADAANPVRPDIGAVGPTADTMDGTAAVRVDDGDTTDGRVPVAPAQASGPGSATPTSMPSQATAPVAAAAAPVSAPPVTPDAPRTVAAQVAPAVLSIAQRPTGTHQLTMTVNPDSLGPVTVRAQIGQAGDVQVELIGGTDAGRDALRSIVADLRRDLAAVAPHATLSVSTASSADASAGRGGQPGADGASGDQGSSRDGAPEQGGRRSATDHGDDLAHIIRISTSTRAGVGEGLDIFA